MRPAYTYRARVLRVYDADTIYVDLDLGCGIHLRGSDGRGEPIRVWGIDAPEVRGEERPRGMASRARVEALLRPSSDSAPEVVIETILDRKGKYGRLLGVVWFRAGGDDGEWVNLARLLVAEGLAEVAEY